MDSKRCGIEILFILQGHFQESSESYPGAVILLSAGITAIALATAVFIQFKVGRKIIPTMFSEEIEKDDFSDQNS